MCDIAIDRAGSGAGKLGGENEQANKLWKLFEHTKIQRNRIHMHKRQSPD